MSFSLFIFSWLSNVKGISFFSIRLENENSDRSLFSIRYTGDNMYNYLTIQLFWLFEITKVFGFDD